MSEPAKDLRLQFLKAPSGASVLAYAPQEKRWENGVLWLVWIVVGAVLLQWPWLAWANREVYDQLPRFGKMGFRSWIDIADLLGLGAQVLLTLALLALPLSGIFVTAGGARARRVMRVILWIMVACIVPKLISGLSFLQTERYLPEGVWTARFEMIAEAVTAAFPLALLAVVLRRSPQPKPWAAAGIWRMTAIACVLAGIGILLPWFRDARQQWLRLLQDVFASDRTGGWYDYAGRIHLLTPFRGIGILAGTFAAAIAYFVMVWIAMRRPKGRPALMICAALWAVYAVGFCGAEVATAFRWASALDFFSAFGRNVATAAARDLGILGTWLAFALAVRVALSLSNVRLLLDHPAR